MTKCQLVYAILSVSFVIGAFYELLYCTLSPKKPIVKKVCDGVVPAAIETLTTMGWSKDDAIERIKQASNQCPQGDESELVNIAIRL